MPAAMGCVLYTGVSLEGDGSAGGQPMYMSAAWPAAACLGLPPPAQHQLANPCNMALIPTQTLPTPPCRFGKPSKGPTVAAAGARPTVAAAIGDGEDPIPVCSLPSALPALEAPSCPEGTTSGADADGNFQ